jgi:hypothetical protein
LFDKNSMPRPAGQGFETHGARTGKNIQHVGIINPPFFQPARMLEHVKNRLPGAVAGRPCGESCRTDEFPAFMGAADNAHNLEIPLLFKRVRGHSTTLSKTFKTNFVKMEAVGK